MGKTNPKRGKDCFKHTKGAMLQFPLLNKQQKTPTSTTSTPKTYPSKQQKKITKKSSYYGTASTTSSLPPPPLLQCPQTLYIPIPDPPHLGYMCHFVLTSPISTHVRKGCYGKPSCSMCVNLSKENVRQCLV